MSDLDIKKTNDSKSFNNGPTLVIHGGAGRIRHEDYPSEREQKAIRALEVSLYAGNEILAKGGSSLDAVEAAVRIMEDDPMFNAGKGSVFTIGGKNELEASIMIGTEYHPAGACTLLHTVKNPISLAKTILKDPNNSHVFLGGKDAEEYAKLKGLEIVDPSYFWTKNRWEQHMKGLENQKVEHGLVSNVQDVDDGNLLSPELNKSPELDFGSLGTVGAVAVDKDGVIAVATSTGGRTNKRDGRIGDTPLIACGTWADNESCGVSGTGDGEFFIRYGIVQDVSARMKYLGESVENAAKHVIDDMKKVGGDTGVIALDKYGNVTMPFNTSGMYRGYIRVSDGIPHVAIFE
ncbi:hypothetical protein G9A89_000914 [Geosiphon pyriformis]|nr:hypothetical protein G9A89_000914 [Geosiphon pyriformis]